MLEMIDGIPVWNLPDPGALSQIRRCKTDEGVVGAALMADHHKGYSMPIGGVVVYRNKVSPSGVGFDISCGNKAVRTDLLANDIDRDIERIMDEIFSSISFGVGRRNKDRVDHGVFDSPIWTDVPRLTPLRKMAREQLGTVGSGNHFVDILVDEVDRVWIANHFGSRGLGHRIATGFMNLAHDLRFDDHPRESMDAPATLLGLDSSLGQDYWQAMILAGEYAYAGRDWVCDRVLHILGAREMEVVHNHHNFAWEEAWSGEKVIVVRKGATPAYPGQRGFVGGSMGDDSVIVEGVEHEESRRGYYSTVHGAGRVMSRRAAAGRWTRNARGKRARQGGQVSAHEMLHWIREKGVTLRGGGVDESPHCYKRLTDVLTHHKNSIRIVHTLRPLGVAMAGEDVFDPYKD